MDDVENAVELFLKHKRPHTQRSYRSTLFALEVVTQKPLTSIKPMDVMAYLDRLARKTCHDGRPVSIATVKRHYHALRSTFNYLVDMEIISHNPAKAAGRAISWRQAEKKRPTATLEWGLTRKALRAQITRNPKKATEYRAIIAILFGAGLRRSELLALNLEHIRVNPWGGLFIELQHTKSGKSQIRDLSKFAWKYISLLIAQRKAEGAIDSDPLLVFYYKDGRERGRMSEKTLYLMFCRVMKAIGVKAAPHSARAALATKLKFLGEEDRRVAQVLGHGSEEMVRVYDHRRLTLENSPLKKVKL